MLATGDLVAGKYRIERLLGEGGMGAVFVATNEKLRKRVALKILRAEVARTEGAAERFTREAIAASSVRHPGIIEIYDADVHDGLPWIAMELLEGESLGTRVARAPLALDEVLAIASEALAALEHVHRAGIIHRDLKPDNLFLEALPEGGTRVKILDFGIAASSGPELVRVTQTGMAIGTPAYLAPEQAAGEKTLDGRVDVYAMGVILFELLTGKLPYRASSFGEMVMRMYTVGPPSLADEAPHAPPQLVALVDMCLVIDRNHRVQSAEALRRGLEEVRASGLTPQTRALAPVHPPPATPIGNPFSGPKVRTPEAFDATMHAPAAARTVSTRSPILWAGLGIGLFGLLAAGAAFALLFGGDASDDGATAEASIPPAVAPVLVPAPRDAGPPDAGPPDAGPPDAGSPDAGPPDAGPAKIEARPVRRARPQPRPEPAPVAPPEPASEPRPLDDQTFMRVIARHEPDIDACYFEIYPELPRPQVRVALDVTVDTLGNVTEANASGGRPALAPCLRRVLNRMRFPAHPHSSRIRSTITLYDSR